MAENVMSGSHPNIKPIIAFAVKALQAGDRTKQVDVIHQYFRNEVWSLEKEEWSEMNNHERLAFAARIFAHALNVTNEVTFNFGAVLISTSQQVYDQLAAICRMGKPTDEEYGQILLGRGLITQQQYDDTVNRS